MILSDLRDYGLISLPFELVRQTDYHLKHDCFTAQMDHQDSMVMQLLTILPGPVEDGSWPLLVWHAHFGVFIAHTWDKSPVWCDISDQMLQEE